MSGNHLKTPLGDSLNLLSKKKVAEIAQLEGQALPCEVTAVDGAIITVKFLVNSVYTLPPVTVPLFGPIYIRYPIQIGDQGVVIPIDASVAGVAGFSMGTSDLSRRTNLTALVFLPVGNANWSEVNPQAVVIYGPDGVVLTDTAGDATITLASGGFVTVTIGNTVIAANGTSVTITADTIVSINAPQIALNGQVTQGQGTLGGTMTMQGPVTVIENLTADGIPLAGHFHGGVTTGGGDTGPALP